MVYFLFVPKQLSSSGGVEKVVGYIVVNYAATKREEVSLNKPLGT